MPPTVSAAVLLNDESAADAQQTLCSILQWRDLAAAHHIASVNLVCVYSQTSRKGLEDVLSELGLHDAAARAKLLEKSGRSGPPALELFSEAEMTIRGDDIILLVAPGAVLSNPNQLGECVREIEEQGRLIYIVEGSQPTALPIAALFSAAVQRTEGLMIVAADGWAIRRRSSFFARSLYRRSGQPRPFPFIDPEAEAFNFDSRWLIGCLACAVGERSRSLRLRSAAWASE